MRISSKAHFWRRLLRRLGRGLFDLAENNSNPCFSTNGERWLLRNLIARHRDKSSGQPFVAIDAGANRGDYSAALLGEARRQGCAITIYAFEPSNGCAEALKSRFRRETSVRLVQAALAEIHGEVELHDGFSGSSLASIARRDATAGAPVARVAAMTLAEFLQNERLTWVDLLKLDVEGAELRALRGAGPKLTPETIGTIQFEYGGTTRDAGASLREIYRLIEGHGFQVGKLLPDSVEVRPYQEWMETFAYANYVAVAPGVSKA